MYHLRLKGDHYQMGVKRGNIFQKAHISFPLQLDNFQLEHGKQSEEILRKFFPEICEEVRGVSDAIGTDYLHFISWMLCMGCCMYNLENNIPVEVNLISHEIKVDKNVAALKLIEILLEKGMINQATYTNIVKHANSHISQAA